MPVSRSSDIIATKPSTRKPPQERPLTKRREPDFVLLSRNLMNYPLARDARTKCHWRRDGEVRWCYLPGEERIWFQLPVDCDRRIPTGFDLNVLFSVLAQASKYDSHTVKLGSKSRLLVKLGLSVNTRNRHHLSDALHLWSGLTVTHHSWHRKGEHTTYTLPPPFEQIDRGLVITVADRWCKAGQAYFKQVPLPLPHHAAVQNLILWVLTAKLNERIGQIRVSTLCRKLGLLHAHRRETLLLCIKEARRWFRDHGGELRCKISGDRVEWTVAEPSEVSVRRHPPRPAAAPSVRPTKTPKERKFSGKSRRSYDDHGYNNDKPDSHPGKIMVMDEDGRSFWVPRSEVEGA